MSEKALWAYVRDGMGGRWDATRHEDKLNLGVPDVSYGMGKMNGWLELKFAERPVRESTPVRVGMRPEQARWLQRRGLNGGGCWVLAQIGEWYLLLEWTVVPMLPGSTFDELRAMARGSWWRKIDFEDFVSYIGKK